MDDPTPFVSLAENLTPVCNPPARGYLLVGAWKHTFGLSRPDSGSDIVPKMGPEPTRGVSLNGFETVNLHPHTLRRGREALRLAIGEFREMKMRPSLERALRHRELLKA